MNEIDLRILSLYTKIERNKKLSKQLKVLAGVCLFFDVCYCLGSMNIGNAEKGQVVLTNLVWIVSVIVLIGIYIKDSSCIKDNKMYEFDIYRMEVEDLNCKKEIANFRGEVLSDDLLNKKIVMPDEKIYLPIVYYGILLGTDIIIRIFVLINTIT